MNRNVNSHFALTPRLDGSVPRSTFDRSSSVKLSFNTGDLVPFYCDEVLPGDTFSVDTSKIVRLQTPITQFMDSMHLDTYYFFVPNRLVWDHWREFMGENTSGPWYPETEYRVPQLVLPDAGVPIGSIADYMGIPTGLHIEGNLNSEDKIKNGFSVSALPFRAYALICNDFFRDENLSQPLNIPTGDSDSEIPSTLSGSDVSNVALGGKPYRAAKYHDYFTSCLPSPQKGPDVPIAPDPIPVVASGSSHFLRSGSVNSVDPLHFTQMSGSPVGDLWQTQDSNHTFVRAGDKVSGSISLTPDNLVVPDFGININDLRLAFALQHVYEIDAYGSRYQEMIKNHFGVTSPDARLQRPEYLGGNRAVINVDQVVQTSGNTAESNLGNTAALSKTVDFNSDFTQSFTEHGYVIGIAVARYDHSYQQGIERMWSRQNRLDFYIPALANIGEQPVLNKEIFLNNATESSHKWNNYVFGYQEAWAEYRFKPSRVCGEMRSGGDKSLDHWHLADDYEEAPFLSDDWIREDPSNVDRVLTVSHTVADQIFAEFYIQNKTTRCMPIYSVPGLHRL